MNFSVKDRPAHEAGAEAVAAVVAEGSSSPALDALDALTGGQVKLALAKDPRAGKPGWTQILYTSAKAPQRVILAGLGKGEGVDAERLRQTYGMAAKAADSAGVKTLAISAPTEDSAEVAKHAQAAVEGAALATYFFGEFKKRTDGGHLGDVTVCTDKANLAAVKLGVSRGTASGEAQIMARTWAELPGNVIYPDDLAQRAAAVAKRAGLKCEIFDEAKLLKHKMHAILAVGRGSRKPPRLIIMEYNGGKKGEPPMALIGKGITFDSGGISLKDSTPSNSGGSIDLMRTDKTGACTVIAAIEAIAKMGVKANVIAVAACAENMPDGDAYRPGDVIDSYLGRKIEILSTDAEGRLVLADALAYTKDRFKPKFMVDIATLTGACVVALGEHASGLMTNNDALCASIETASRYTGEHVWRLPLWEPYLEQTKSKLADLQNTGGRAGGAITAAAFLWDFVGNDVPWAHLDIAGPSHIGKDRPYLPKGATGIPTRTLIELVEASAGK